MPLRCILSQSLQSRGSGGVGGAAQGAAILEALQNCSEEPQVCMPQSCLGHYSAAFSKMGH